MRVSGGGSFLTIPLHMNLVSSTAAPGQSPLNSRPVVYYRKGGTTPRLRFALRSPAFGLHEHSLG